MQIQLLQGLSGVLYPLKHCVLLCRCYRQLGFSSAAWPLLMSAKREKKAILATAMRCASCLSKCMCAYARLHLARL